MKLFPCVLLCCLGLCSLVPAWCSPAVAQGRPAVVSVSFHTENARKERVRIKLEGRHAPKVYSIAGEKPRLVVDFPGAGYAGLVTPLVKDGDTLVKNIRVGVHQKPAAMVRVVLDLQPGWKYTYSRDFVKEENILNIVLAPAARIKKTEPPIARINADETKRMVANETKKSLPSGAAQPPPPAPAEKPVLDLAASAAPVKTAAGPAKAETTPVKAAAKPAKAAAEPAKAETAASVPPPAPREADKTVKETDVAPASAAIPQPKETAAKVEPTVTARPAAQPQAQKPAAPAATPKNVAAAAPSAEKPEKKTAEAGQKIARPAPAPADQATKTPPAAPAQAGIALQADPLLLDITYENSSSKGEMVFFRLNGFFPPSVSAVESDNPQVVCEFANTAKKGNIKPVIETKGAYVQKISTSAGKDSKKIQVTLQLTPGRDYDLRQVFFKEDNLFVLVVNAMDEENVGGAAADEKK